MNVGQPPMRRRGASSSDASTETNEIGKSHTLRKTVFCKRIHRLASEDKRDEFGTLIAAQLCGERVARTRLRHVIAPPACRRCDRAEPQIVTHGISARHVTLQDEFPQLLVGAR